MKLQLNYIALFFILVFSFNAFSQDKKKIKTVKPVAWILKEKVSKSELKSLNRRLKQEIEVKDTITLPSEARLDRLRQKYLYQIYEEGEAMFYDNDVPERWHDKSAVIIAQTFEHTYHKRSPQLVIEQRVKIKLQDKAAVENFSEVYFIDKEKSAFRIIKSDGTYTDLNLNDAVKLDKGELIPDRYFSINKSYYKLAIKGLEIGDIIDFYIIGKLRTYVFKEGVFPPFLVTMNDKYPVVREKYVLSVHKKFFINCLPANGAPDIDWIPISDKRQKFFKYEIEGKDYEELKPEIWKEDLRSYPTLKFQILRSRKRFVKKSNYFLGQPNQPKTSVNEKEIGRIVSINYKFYNKLGYDATKHTIKRHLKKTKKHGKRNVNNKEAYIYDAYYFFRHLYGDFYGFSQNRVSDMTFVYTMREILKDKNIKSEVLVIIPRGIGEGKNLLLREEMQYALYIRMGGEDIILHPFDLFSLHNEAELGMEGSDAFIVTPKKRILSAKAIEYKLPESNYKNHGLEWSMEVYIPEEMNKIQINRTSVISGLMKKYYNQDVLIPQDFMKTDDLKFKVKRKYQNESAELKRLLIEWKRNNEEQRLKNLEENIEKDFELLEYKDFKLLSCGRYRDSTTLEYKENFIIDGLLKSAGDNYLLEFGEFIGKQIELREKDKERDADIYLPFARTYKYAITMTIPNGYTLHGIERLNFTNETEVGGFVSSAYEEDNKLYVKIEMHIKKSYEPLENWSTLVHLLEVAYDINQSKLLLRKRDY